MLSVQDAFEILGLSPGAPLKEVRKAYLALVRSWHPDRHSQDLRLQHIAQERLKEINAAYQIARKHVVAPPSVIDSPFRFNPPAKEPFRDSGASAFRPPSGGGQAMSPRRRPKQFPHFHNILLGILGLSTSWISLKSYGMCSEALMYFLLIMSIPLLCGIICNSPVGNTRLRHAYLTAIVLAWTATVFHQISLRSAAVPTLLQGEDEWSQGVANSPSVTIDGPVGYTLHPSNREAWRGPTPPQTPVTPQSPEIAAPEHPSSPAAPLRR